MEYTVKKLASLAGVSARTLRYYDEIGLLQPRRNDSGYRIYTEIEVDRLQQILFFRELGVELDTVLRLMSDPSFDRLDALNRHRSRLLARRDRLNMLLENVEKTILNEKGVTLMNDSEKFEGFKKDLINKNEQLYGKEIREKYGEREVEMSNSRFINMNAQQYAQFKELGNSVLSALKEAFGTGDPASPSAQNAAALHRDWLKLCWGRYDPIAHANLTAMYVEDERFRAYYDRDQPGLAEFLRDAVLILTGEKTQ